MAGIPIRVHFTLVLFLSWVLWLNYRAGGPLAIQALLLAGLFLSVLLHELGHALAARHFGIRSTEIVLYPFGGVARMVSLGQPRQEFWISLAGPAVNLAIGMGLTAGLGLGAAWQGAHGQLPGTDALRWLMMANYTLAGFNLIPAFPLDGGRVVRAQLARRLGMVRATSVAAAIGQGFAIAMGLAAIFMGHVILMFIAFFIFIGAGQEVLVQRSRAALRGRRVVDAMVTRYETLAHDAVLSQAADLLLATQQEDFPVLAGQEIVGILTRVDLVHGLANLGPGASVAESARRSFLALDAGDSLERALEQMRAASQRVALVFRERAGERSLVGMLSEENVSELLQLDEAGQRSDPRS